MPSPTPEHVRACGGCAGAIGRRCPVAGRRSRLAAMADLAAIACCDAMEFGFLFDPGRQLLSIGYRGADGSLDANFYDLLASEARLASFVAIAKGDRARQALVSAGTHPDADRRRLGLISWSGSMFEYLMPSLVMRAPAGSLLEQTNRLVVWRQEKYGADSACPGACRNPIQRPRRRADLSIFELRRPRSRLQARPRREHRHRALCDRRSRRWSIPPPPRATSSAWPRSARAAPMAGTRRSTTRRRACPKGTKFAIIRAYMAHHQAMTLVGIANALHDGAMRARFHAEPMVQAAELLLQERMPRDVAVARPPPEQTSRCRGYASFAPDVQRRYTSAHSRAPRTHLLSNGRYSVMLTAAGSGYSRWHDIAITRWREDVTCDGWGAYIFLRDVRSGGVWSAGYQPSAAEPDSYEVTFSEDRAEIIAARRRRSRRHWKSSFRRKTTRRCAASRSPITATARAEYRGHLLRRNRAGAAGRRRGPSGLRQTVRARPSSCPSLGAILATRRRRSAGRSAGLGGASGRGRRRQLPATCNSRPIGRASSGAGGPSARPPRSPTAGRCPTRPAPVLDPIFSLRRRVRDSRRGATARIAFWTMVAASREDVLDLADKHRDAMAFERATTLAWTQAQMQLRHLGIDAERGAPVPAPRQSRPLFRPDAATARRPARARRAQGVDAVGAGNFRRSAHRAGPDRGRRRHRSRAPAAARTRILAPEAAGGRSGDPQRARRILCPGHAGSRSTRWCG